MMKPGTNLTGADAAAISAPAIPTRIHQCRSSNSFGKSIKSSIGGDTSMVGAPGRGGPSVPVPAGAFARRLFGWLACAATLLFAALAFLGFCVLALLAAEITFADQIWNSRRGAHDGAARDRRAAAFPHIPPKAAARRFSEWERVLDILLFLFATAALTLVGYWAAAAFVIVVFAWLVVGRELREIGVEAHQ